MIRSLFRALPADPAYRRSLISVSALLIAMNVGAWFWALITFAGQPVLLGVAIVVYGLGLRHALDADHIAAIDNVTRKLLREGQRSASIGLWFALGHSTVILLATAAVVAAAGSLSHLQGFREIGGTISTMVSGIFLLLVAAMNICIFLAIVRTVRRVRAGYTIEEANSTRCSPGTGFSPGYFDRCSAASPNHGTWGCSGSCSG